MIHKQQIVEGYEKSNNNEFVRYLKIAKGSWGETRNHLHVALTVGYITQKEFNAINELLLSLSKQIVGFIKYLEEHKKLRNKK